MVSLVGRLVEALAAGCSSAKERGEVSDREGPRRSCIRSDAKRRRRFQVDAASGLPSLSYARTPVRQSLALQRPFVSAAAERMPSLAASMLDFDPQRIAAETPSGRNPRISLPAKTPLALATNRRGAVVLAGTWRVVHVGILAGTPILLRERFPDRSDVQASHSVVSRSVTSAATGRSCVSTGTDSTT